MTRFARAKGSKSSNEKAPEDSTPWEVMKEQLLQAKSEGEQAKKRKEAEKQRIENYENFLKEHKVQKRKATWCEFPETDRKQAHQMEISSPKKKKNKQKQTNGVAQSISTSEDMKNDNVLNTPSKKLKKKHNSEHIPPTQAEPTEDSIEKSVKTKKKNKKKQKTVLLANNTNDNENNGSQVENPNNNNNKKNKNKIQKQNFSSAAPNQENDNEITIAKNIIKKKKKDKKLVDGTPQRRKPINDRSFQLIINGKEVELLRFDGFPIMKKDAERLEELKNNMIKKGIPKSEVNRTLKLERRRAEKALARLKRDVCYNCRKGGHNLSDCPELKTKIPGVGAADGVCFKCGSTEHKQFECKVQNDKEFRFATCFICKEPGHIARQCPDNPKGLYPNGGSCKLCGDVTHLRKDCPTATDKKEETSIKLQTLESTEHLEGIEKALNKSVSHETTKKPKKIKF